MAEDRSVARPEYYGEPPALARNDAMADRVDPWLEDVQSASLNAAVDRARAQPNGHQLPSPHHAVLPSSQPSDLPV